MSTAHKKKLTILWTNDNPVTAELMVFMYAIHTKQHAMWDEMTIVVWGATVKLVKENPKIQSLVKKAQEAGVHISACRSCADELDATDALEDLGIELIYWGEPLTKIIQNDEKLITI
ncbi:MAG: DsrE family protein [Desulfoplanes sp.]|nr:DsrE family protein [Desulfoplanes sp.]MDD4649844.1 DsrE family protein [Desulfoplanes sp.]